MFYSMYSVYEHRTEEVPTYIQYDIYILYTARFRWQASGGLLTKIKLLQIPILSKCQT